MSNEYITIRKATKKYGISAPLFRTWCKQGYIKSSRTPGNNRLFSIKDIENTLSIDNNCDKKKKIIYCRVSSVKQKDDLERQIKYLQKMYPNYDIITDIGSGINFKRKGIQTILEFALQRNIEEIVVAYKDRLARFGYELFEKVIELSGGKITIVNNEKYKSNSEELAEDLLSIIHIFNCRQMGKRRYGDKKLQDKNISK